MQEVESLEPRSIRQRGPECPICQDIFKHPKVLSCGHSFCLECLRLLAPRGSKIIKCPLCMNKGKLANGDVYELPTNFGLQDAIDSMYGDECVPSDSQIHSLEAHEDADLKKPNMPDAFSNMLQDIMEDEKKTRDSDPTITEEDVTNDPDEEERERFVRKMIIGSVAAAGTIAVAASAVIALPAIGITAGGIAAGSLAAKGLVATTIAAKTFGAAGVAGGTYAAARSEAAGKTVTQLKDMLEEAGNVGNEDGNSGKDKGSKHKEKVGEDAEEGTDKNGSLDMKDIKGDENEDSCSRGDSKGTGTSEKEAESGGGWGYWASSFKDALNSSVYGTDEDAPNHNEEVKSKKEGVVENEKFQGTSGDDKKTSDDHGGSGSSHGNGGARSSGGWGLWATQMKDMVSAVVYGDEEGNVTGVNESASEKPDVAVEVGKHVSRDADVVGTNADSARNRDNRDDSEIPDDTDAQENIDKEEGGDEGNDGVNKSANKENVAAKVEIQVSSKDSDGCSNADNAEPSRGDNEKSSDTNAQDNSVIVNTCDSDIVHDAAPVADLEHCVGETETGCEIVDDDDGAVEPSGDDVIDEGCKDESSNEENNIGQVGNDDDYDDYDEKDEKDGVLEAAVAN